MKLAAFGLVLGMATSACNHEVLCAGVGLIRVIPGDTTISLHGTLALRYQEGGTCNPGHPVDSDYHDVATTWFTADTAIVQLDTVTGRVVARALGDARINPTGRTLLAITVHVR